MKEWRNRFKREIRIKANREYQTEQNDSSKMKFLSDNKNELKREKYNNFHGKKQEKYLH